MSEAPWKTDIQDSGSGVKLKSQRTMWKKHRSDKMNIESLFALGNDLVDLLLSPQCVNYSRSNSP